VRMPAPTFVMSVTPHERTPVCPLKNSNAPLAILVLPMDLRSSIVIAPDHGCPILLQSGAAAPPSLFHVKMSAVGATSGYNERQNGKYREEPSHGCLLMRQ
jgi:hypothetical protein